MDATKRGPTDERQMTSAADSLYGAVFRAQTVTLHRPPPAAIPALVSATHSLTILHAVLFVTRDPLLPVALNLQLEQKRASVDQLYITSIRSTYDFSTCT